MGTSKPRASVRGRGRGCGRVLSVSPVTPRCVKKREKASGSSPGITTGPATPVDGGSKTSGVTFEGRLTASFCLYCISLC